MDKLPELSVFFPCYNEEASIKQTVDKALRIIPTVSEKWEIILVNDGSKDKTGEIADELARKYKNIRVVHHSPNRGYGAALKSGLYAARYEWIAFTDSDGQFDISEISNLINLRHHTGVDMVIGYYKHRQVSLSKIITSRIWELIVNLLFGLKVKDIDCGFKLIAKKVIDTIPHLESERGAFISSELLVKATNSGFKLTEIPVTHFPRKTGQGTGRHLKVIIKSFLDLFRLWTKLKLIPNKLEIAALLIIIVVGAFSRLYRINDYMTFLGDEGRDAIVMKGIVTGTHFPLIGPGTSIGNMYLGPLYYYLAAPSLALFNLSPLGPAVFIVAIGLLTIGLIWWIGRQWFGRWPALGVSALYALSPTVIVYSRSSWNPNIMPFFALLTMYGIWKVWRFGYWRWLVISAVSFAFVLNSHYLGLLLLPSVAIFLFLAPKNPSTKRSILISLSAISFLISPLILFDYRHGWQNFGAMKTFFAARQTTVNLKAYKALPNLWPIWQDMVTSLLAGKNKTVGYFTAFGLMDLAILYAVRKRRSPDFWFTVSWIGFGLIGLGLYKQHIYDHYYGFLFPAIFLLLGFTFKFTKYFTIPAFIILLFISLVNTPLRIGPNYQLSRTIEISKFIKDQSVGQPFNLALLTKNNYDASYRYFLQLNNAPYYTIHDKLADQLFVICEMSECNPINNPLWEIAAFGWSKIDATWDFPWGFKVMRLVHNI